jgi:hypothetical protein
MFFANHKCKQSHLNSSQSHQQLFFTEKPAHIGSATANQLVPELLQWPCRWPSSMASVAFYTLIKTGYEVALYHSRQSITQSPIFVFILHQCTSAGPWTAFHLVYMSIEGSSLSSPSVLHFQTLPKPEEERQICTDKHTTNYRHQS